MGNPSDLEARVTAVEARVEIAVEDAAIARHLSAARDRDIADLAVKVDANRIAINALGVQTAARFDTVDRRFNAVDQRFNAVDQRFDAIDQRLDTMQADMDRGFGEMRAKLDQTAGGMQRIVELLTDRIDDPNAP